MERESRKFVPQGFKQRQAAVLEGLSESSGDKSRKGSVDAPIAELVELINSLGSIFTTSSCSGRLSIFGEPPREHSGETKKGGEWVFATHEKPVVSSVLKAITERLELGSLDCPLILRFEPFILAAECQSMDVASQFVICGRDAGFRESGITIGSDKIIASIRSNSRLEVPVVANGRLLVPQEYLTYVVELTQERFEENIRRVECFQEHFCERLLAHRHNGGRCLEPSESLVPHEKAHQADLVPQALGEVQMDRNISSGPLEWKVVTSQGISVQMLERWGHSACEIDGLVVVFGGYGGCGAHHRLNDIIVLNPKSSEWSSPEISGDIPSPRMGHTCTKTDKGLVIFGGRFGPAAPLNDVYVCKQDQDRWVFERMTNTESSPSLYRHSAVEHKGCLVVFGGCSTNGPQNSTWKLDTDRWTWDVVEPHGQVPCPRMGHAACVVGSTLFVHGGFSDYHHVYDDLFAMDLSTSTWMRVDIQEYLPACFSHSMTAVDDCLVLFGGCPKRQTNSVLLVKPSTGTSRVVNAKKRKGEMVPVRHTACVVGNELYCIGGGAFCFSFGTLFSRSWSLDLRPLMQHMSTSNGVESWAFWTHKSFAKRAKDELKKRGWLDVGMKSCVKGEKIGLPVLYPGAQTILRWQGSLDESGEAGGDSGSNTFTGISDILRELVAGGASVERSNMNRSKRKSHPAPHSNLRMMVQSVLHESKLVKKEDMGALMSEMPTKWERLGDLVLIPEDSMTSEIWQTIGQSVWEALTKGLKAARLARQSKIASTGTRDSQVFLLLGNDGWVQHKETGVTYALDVTRCMFSSGNVTERARMGALNCSGEIIVDLYAGIGYYTLPLLCKAKASLVHACEWNPHAIEALRHGLCLNGVHNQCIIHQGDCREVAPVGCADRVILGLLPTSEGGWETAIKAIKTSGGWLHVHCNVVDKEETAWKASTITQFQNMIESLGMNWKVELAHCEHVKWYAPHVRHVVLDIKLSPRKTAVNATPAPDPLRTHSIKDGQAEAEVEEGPQACDRSDSKPTIDPVSLTVLENPPSSGDFQKYVVAGRKPVVIRGVVDGSAWTYEHLKAHPESESTLVSVHVCDHPEGLMDFVEKNFSFHTMTLRELLERCAGLQGHEHFKSLNEKYYLRTIGKNPRKEPSSLSKVFPNLFKSLQLPDFVPDGEVFSTILRVSSPGTRLWTHFDAMDNVLIQIQGTKRIRLWAPEEEPNLYIEGSSSRVINIEDPDVNTFPSFKKAKFTDCTLREGEGLFIPALWFHNVLAEDFSISINMFFHHAPQSLHDRKDLYGNRDPLPVQEAEKMIYGIAEKLGSLPPAFKEFYGRRLCRKLEQCLE